MKRKREWKTNYDQRYKNNTSHSRVSMYCLVLSSIGLEHFRQKKYAFPPLQLQHLLLEKSLQIFLELKENSQKNHARCCRVKEDYGILNHYLDNHKLHHQCISEKDTTGIDYGSTSVWQILLYKLLMELH